MKKYPIDKKCEACGKKLNGDWTIVIEEDKHHDLCQKCMDMYVKGRVKFWDWFSEVKENMEEE